MERVELADFLIIAEIHTGIDAHRLVRMPRVVQLGEAALAAPFAGFGELELFPEIHQKAGVYASRIVRYHPLPDGNKRTAYDVMIEFLERNDLRFIHGDGGLDETAEAIERLAADDLSERDFIAWLLPASGTDGARAFGRAIQFGADSAPDRAGTWVDGPMSTSVPDSDSCALDMPRAREVVGSNPAGRVNRSSASRIAVSSASWASISTSRRLAIDSMRLAASSVAMTRAISSRLSPKRWACLIIRTSVTVCGGYCRCPEPLRAGGGSSPRRS